MTSFEARVLRRRGGRDYPGWRGGKIEGTLSGRFLQVEEWTCLKHDKPQRHYCDCDQCFREWDCAGCSGARWRGKVDENGEPVFRELRWHEVPENPPAYLERRVMWEGKLFVPERVAA